MLFSEIYGAYYRAVGAILTEAAAGTLTPARMTELVREKAFAESVLTIPAALQSGAWPLLTPQGGTPLRHAPTMPLSLLEKRWLKTLLSDPRIALFAPPSDGLEGIEPLYRPQDLVYFDRCADGDPWDDAAYAARFQVILTALREKRRLRVSFADRGGRRHTWNCAPCRLEYSPRDDKFRLITACGGKWCSINLARITACTLQQPCVPQECHVPVPPRETVVLTLRTERNALERAMLEFSYLEKQTEFLGGGRFRLTLHYEREDETELLIRILSFGPLLHVEAPEHFAGLVRERLQKQQSCGL